MLVEDVRTPLPATIFRRLPVTDKLAADLSVGSSSLGPRFPRIEASRFTFTQ